LIAIFANCDHRHTTSRDGGSRGGGLTTLPLFAFKDRTMYSPFHYRIRFLVGLAFLVILLLVGFVATLGVVHTP
jgi:hypothetical protein